MCVGIFWHSLLLVLEGVIFQYIWLKCLFACNWHTDILLKYKVKKKVTIFSNILEKGKLLFKDPCNWHTDILLKYKVKKKKWQYFPIFWKRANFFLRARLLPFGQDAWTEECSMKRYTWPKSVIFSSVMAKSYIMLFSGVNIKFFNWQMTVLACLIIQECNP